MDVNENNTKQNQLSVYRRGAEDGLGFGIYLSFLMLAMMLTFHEPLLSLVSLAMIIGVPFLAYRSLRRGVRGRQYGGRFSEAWMHGISVFFFGALIMGLVMYVYIRFFDPDYIADNVRHAIVVLRDNPSADSMETARRLQMMIDKKLLPGPIQLVFATIWLVVFTGSLLSMLLSMIAINSERKRSIEKRSDNSE